MESYIDGFELGIKNYFTNSHFTNIQNVMGNIENENNVQMSSFGSNYMRMGYYGNSQNIQNAMMINNLFIMALIIAVVSFGFIAVGKICTDTSERGKNTRLGLYAMLILTGGQVGWLYILMWLLKIDICI